MNKERRNKINSVVKMLDTTINDLKEILFDEEIAFDNMPENLQGSIRGEESEEAIDVMNEALDLLQSVCDNLDSI